jgi:hypothetical protein
MSHLPLTRPGPWTELPASAGMEPLFDELGPLRASPVEVMVTVPALAGRRCVMDLLVAEGDLLRALTVAAEACRGVDDFELTARRFGG